MEDRHPRSSIFHRAYRYSFGTCRWNDEAGYFLDFGSASTLVKKLVDRKLSAIQSQNCAFDSA
jgi:hypothetical protein